MNHLCGLAMNVLLDAYSVCNSTSHLKNQIMHRSLAETMIIMTMKTRKRAKIALSSIGEYIGNCLGNYNWRIAFIDIIVFTSDPREYHM